MWLLNHSRSMDHQDWKLAQTLPPQLKKVGGKVVFY